MAVITTIIGGAVILYSIYLLWQVIFAPFYTPASKIVISIMLFLAGWTFGAMLLLAGLGF